MSLYIMARWISQFQEFKSMMQMNSLSEIVTDDDAQRSMGLMIMQIAGPVPKSPPAVVACGSKVVGNPVNSLPSGSDSLIFCCLCRFAFCFNLVCTEVLY